MYGKTREGGVRAAVVWDIQALGSSRGCRTDHRWVGPDRAPQLSGREEAVFSISRIGKQIIQASGQTKAQGSVGVGVSYSIGRGSVGHGGGFLETHTRPRESRGSQTLAPASKADFRADRFIRGCK